MNEYSVFFCCCCVLFTLLTSNTDSEVVSKYLSYMSYKIRPVGEAIRNGFPLITIWGI